MSGPPDHWFEPIADHLGRAYLRYSFTKGTTQEVAFLSDVLGLRAGMRVLYFCRRCSSTPTHTFIMSGSRPTVRTSSSGH